MLEQTLNRIGGKYGASHLGTAAVTGSGVVDDYLQGKTAEDILLNSIISTGTGKVGQKIGEDIDVNPSVFSTLLAAGTDTAIDKNDAEKEKQRIDFNK